VILLVTVAVLLAAALGWRYWQGHSFGSDAPLPEGVVGEAGPVTVEACRRARSTPRRMRPRPRPRTTPRCWPTATIRWWPMPICMRGLAAGGPLPVDESQSKPSRPEPASATLETAAADE
jgi:hypothetical protein